MCSHARPAGLVLLLMVSVLISGGGFAQSPNGGKTRRVAILAEITGIIGPATVRYTEKAIEKAKTSHAEVLIFRLDTPGGLVTSMREIVKDILAAPVPVVAYVAPPGAHAASAGTYILYAANIAAMAPGTNIGAATPVQIGGLPGLPTPADEKPGNQPSIPGQKDAGKPSPPASSNVLEIKSTNDAVALIRGLAELRGRNADWAEKAVREAATLHARQALGEHVIDIVAGDIDELLKDIDGREVVLGNRETRTLATAGVTLVRFKPDVMTKVLGVLANPDIALILMLVGIYGLIFEFMNPGTVLPGVAGTISLLLGLYALQELPLDYAGLALLVLGISFMIAEAFLPSFGVLGIGGIAAFAIGAAMLIDTDIPEYRISVGVIASAAAVSAGFLILLAGYMWRSHRRKVRSGPEQLIGSKAVVLDWMGGEGHVWIEGERWNARGGGDFSEGDHVTIKDRHGLTLIVDPV